MDSFQTWDALAEKVVALNSACQPLPVEVWEELYGCARAQVHSMLSRRIPLEDAEDMTEEALQRAWSRLRTFQGRGGGGAALCRWVQTVAINLLRDAVRRPDARVLRESDIAGGREPDDDPGRQLLDEAEPLWGESADPEAVVLEHEERRWIASELARLPDKQRRAFMLRAQGHSFRTIANIMGVSEAAAKMNRGRALRALQRRWVQYDREG